MKKKLSIFLWLCMFTALATGLQGCSWWGGNDPFQSKATTKSGTDVKVNTAQEAKFQGSIYFTLDRNLYVLDGDGNLKQLTKGIDARDPAVSPDGKKVAFIQREKNYSDLVYMATSGDTTIHTVVTGNGQYYQNAQGANNYYWFAQPSWSPDGTHLLFLSDLEKTTWIGQLPGTIFNNASLLDMQAFSLPYDTPTLTGDEALNQAQIMAYAYYGDGGIRDPSYRPNHAEQIVYTNYMYDEDTATKQMIQIALEDTTLLTGAQGASYHPGNEPSVDLTPGTADLVNFQPMFSPDGNTIAYIRREGTTQMSLYVMAVADEVTADPASQANQQNALAPYNQSTKLLTQQYISQPVWSPDGKHLLYYGYANNTFDIWMVTVTKDAKSGKYSVQENSQVQLTQAGGHLDGDSRASWTN